MACTKVAKSMNSNLCLLKRLSLVALTLLLIPWPSAAQTQVEQDYVNIEDFIRSNDNNKTSDDGGDGVEYVDLLSDFQLQEGVMNEDDHSHDHSSSSEYGLAFSFDTVVPRSLFEVRWLTSRCICSFGEPSKIERFCKVLVLNSG